MATGRKRSTKLRYSYRNGLKATIGLRLDIGFTFAEAPCSVALSQLPLAA